MSEFRLSPEAEAELDGIWIHLASETTALILPPGCREHSGAFLATGPASLYGPTARR
jgi:hypothetical protein